MKDTVTRIANHDADRNEKIKATVGFLPKHLFNSILRQLYILCLR